MDYIQDFLYLTFRSLYKVFMRRLTGNCELLRLTLTAKNRVTLTNNIENSINLSKYPLLHTVFDNPPSNLDRYIFSIIALKKIKAEHRIGFKFLFGGCLVRLLGLKAVKKTVNEFANSKFDFNNKSHLTLLHNMLGTLDEDPSPKFMPKKTIEVSDSFRNFLLSRNLLMLYCIQYYINNFKSMAKLAYVDSMSVEGGYDFYVIAHDIASELDLALSRGNLNSYFYSSDKPVIKDFYRLFVQCFSRFHAFWNENGFLREEEEDARKRFKNELHHRFSHF